MPNRSTLTCLLNKSKARLENLLDAAQKDPAEAVTIQCTFGDGECAVRAIRLYAGAKPYFTHTQECLRDTEIERKWLKPE